MMVSFQPLLEVPQGVQVLPLELLDPTLVDLVNGDRVEVVQFFAPPANRRNQVGVLQSPEVLRDRLAGHVEVRAELPQRLAALRSKTVEQTPPCRIGECLEHLVHVHAKHDMLENTCMSTPAANARKAAAADRAKVRCYRGFSPHTPGRGSRWTRNERC